MYMGDASQLLEGSYDVVKGTIPTWGLWAVSPAAVTWCSFSLSSAVQTVCDLREAGATTQALTSELREAGKTTEEPLTSNSVFSRPFRGIRATMKGARDRLGEEPWLCLALVAWVTQGVANWTFFVGMFGPPVAFTFARNTSASDRYSVVMSSNKMSLYALNGVLLTGLATKTLGVSFSRFERVAGISDFRMSAEGNGVGDIRGNCCASSRVPSLLTG